MRCTRLSRYSGVISPADSRRTPRSILAIIARLSSAIAGSSLPVSRMVSGYRDCSGLLDHPDGLALRARDRVRRHEREVDREASALVELLRHLVPEPRELGMAGLEAAAAGQQRGCWLDAHLQTGQGARAVHDEHVVRLQI